MEKTKKERTIESLKNGDTPMEIRRAGICSSQFAYKCKKELKEQGWEFSKRLSRTIKKEPKDEFERIQFEHNKTVLDIQAETGLPLKDLRLSTNSDPYCLLLSAIKTGMVMARIWEDDGWKEKYDQWVELGKPMDKKSERRELLIHPRGLHYKIHSRYDIVKDNKSMLYNKYDESHWVYCQLGLKFARQMGLIPYDALKDLINPPPDNIPYYRAHKGFEIPTYTDVSNDVHTHDFNNRFRYFGYKHVGKVIRWKSKSLAKELIGSIRYYTNTARPNHLEIWCEKSEIIPFDIADKFHMEVRERGSGEASDMMCYDAVMTAKKAEKNLVVFEMSDFDSAGEGMPISTSRKIQWYAEREGVQAFVYPVALNYRQIKEYELPYSPPAEGTKYTGGYATRASNFYKKWDMVGMMINVFKGENLKGLKQEIENAVSPHYDDELSDKIDEAEEELRLNIERTLRKSMRPNIHKLKAKRRGIKHKETRINCNNRRQEDNNSQYDSITDKIYKRFQNRNGNISDNYEELTGDIEKKRDKLLDAINEKYGKLTKPYEDKRDELIDAVDEDYDTRVEPYDKRIELIKTVIGAIIEKKRERIGIDVKEYKELLEIDLSEVLEGVEFEMPEADISKGEDALLNTNRGYMEQLKKYREYQKKGRHDQNVNNTKVSTL